MLALPFFEHTDLHVSYVSIHRRSVVHLAVLALYILVYTHTHTHMYIY